MTTTKHRFGYITATATRRAPIAHENGAVCSTVCDTKYCHDDDEGDDGWKEGGRGTTNGTYVSHELLDDALELDQLGASRATTRCIDALDVEGRATCARPLIAATGLRCTTRGTCYPYLRALGSIQRLVGHVREIKMRVLVGTAARSEDNNRETRWQERRREWREMERRGWSREVGGIEMAREWVRAIESVLRGRRKAKRSTEIDRERSIEEAETAHDVGV